MRANEIRVTASITDDLAKEFTDLTRQVGVSGTALISRTLPRNWITWLRIPRNSGRARKALEMVSDAETGRINFTLCRQDAERMDAICKEKMYRGIPFCARILIFCATASRTSAQGLTLVNKILAVPATSTSEKTGPKHVATHTVSFTLPKRLSMRLSRS